MTPHMIKHKHHIIPKHAGGTDDPSNLVEVTHTQHIMFHYCEWKRTGNEYDRIAFKGLSGRTPTAEQSRAEAARHYMKNRIVSEETRQKISKARKGVPNPNRKGKLHSNTTKQQMSRAAIKNRGRSIRCVELDKTWESPVFAAEELGIPVKQIKKAANPKETKNKTARGLHFEYLKPPSQHTKN